MIKSQTKRLIKRTMMLSFIILPLIAILLFQSGVADDDYRLNAEQPDVKELKENGEISSLEAILQKLHDHDISRVLEVELEKKNNRYVYEIEYLNTKGMVYEVEVDALTSQVMKTKREH